MSISFSGGPIIFNSITSDTTSHLIGGIQTALVSAGWTVISGGATTNLVMQTVSTPQGLAMRFKFHDNGYTVSSVATIQISIQTTNGATIGADNSSGNSPWLRVNTTTNYTIIAGPYYFWLVVPGSYADYGLFGFGGVPFIESFQTATTQLGYLVTQTKGIGAPTGVSPTFRINNSCCLQNQVAQTQLIYNTNYISLDGSSQSGRNTQGDSGYIRAWLPAFSQQYCNATSGMNMVQFSDGSFATADPWVGWDSTTSVHPADTGDTSFIQGMLWDAVFIFDNSQIGDATTTFLGHNWYAISNLQTPTLWVATT